MKARKPNNKYIRKYKCKHCRNQKCIKARGICHKCYRDKEVRKMYKACELKEIEVKTLPEYKLDPRLPCPYPKYSEMQLACMAARAELRISLFNDEDCIEVCKENFGIRRNALK